MDETEPDEKSLSALTVTAGSPLRRPPSPQASSMEKNMNRFDLLQLMNPYGI